MTQERERWEYCKVDGMHGGVLGSLAVHPRLVFFTEKGAKIEHLREDHSASAEDRVARKIAELGREGWELAGAGTDSHGYAFAYFKRRQN